MEKQSNQLLARKRAGWLLFSMLMMMAAPLVSIILYRPNFWSELFGINETMFRIPLAWILGGQHYLRIRHIYYASSSYSTA